MKTFTLTKSGTSYDFEPGGRVTQAGAGVGSWSVTPENRIRLTPTNGAKLDFDVGWSFIDNQLWLVVDGQRLYNFHAERMPDYEVSANRIQVRPLLVSSDFTFTLTCEYRLDKDLDLMVKIGGIESSLVGALEDTYGRFLYRFTDPVFNTADVLILDGDWQKDTTIEGEVRLKFVYSSGGQTREIAVPRAFEVNRTTNALRLRYEKEGNEHYLELGGEIQFKNNTTVVFSVKQRGTTRTNEIEYNFRLSGVGKTVKELELTIIKSNGDGGSSLVVRGSLSRSVGKGGLTLTFQYARKTGGTNLNTKVQIAVDGRFTTPNGRISFSYAQDGSTKTIAVALTDYKLGDVGTLSAAFQVVVNGQVRAVRGCLSLTW